MSVNKKNIIGYAMVIGVVLMVLTKMNFIDPSNYKDYQMSETELSSAKPIKLTSRDKPYCAGDDGYKPGFYDIKALGGSAKNKDYTEYAGSYLKKGNFLNNIYINDSECILIDGDVELIPASLPSEDYTQDSFTINETTDLVVGKNIAPGEYEITADIPENTSLFVTTNNNNKIANGNLSASMTNEKGLDNSGYKNIKFKAVKNDVISIELRENDEEEKNYASFDVHIKKID